ncbi:FAD binding domain-containing protein [Breznakiella homolactica]|uniref:FAD binding domain-containing protein n=1 Tax=Breznakiella homolactica TaxID=2798577 RepID=A0A7T7XKN0_9SPIR|nr:FAD binding domain-containing protein [Breznakiella homolactica]QQO08050.1 FAD binding domain-containing protein [Breznakiella homolactica]
MDVPHSQVFFPTTMTQLFSAWNRFPSAIPFAGGTGLLYGQGNHEFTLPSNILSLDRLEELHRISRTERYLEIGAMVGIDEILRLGKIVPEALNRTLRETANPLVRNIATIGGNICFPNRRLDASCPMVALDARYELRTAAASRWVSAARFTPLQGTPVFNKQELLTRIRIPLEHWDYTVFRKIGARQFGDTDNGVILFIARAQKNILSEVRLVFSGENLLRDKNSESTLAGKQLPLDRKDAVNFIGLWETYLGSLAYPGDFLKARILAFIESTIVGLSY